MAEVIDKDISRHLCKICKMLQSNKKHSQYYDFCYSNMTEMTCERLTQPEKKEVMNAINKVRQGGYPDFPAVKDCFFNSILIALFSKGNVTYVEGWYWDIVPLEHGWCKIGSKYFDPTVLFNEDKYNPNIKYFGMGITFEEIAKYGIIDLNGKNPKVESVIPNMFKDKIKRKEF